MYLFSSFSIYLALFKALLFISHVSSLCCYTKYQTLGSLKVKKFHFTTVLALSSVDCSEDLMSDGITVVGACEADIVV